MRRVTAAITVLVMLGALFGAARLATAQGNSVSYTVQPGDNLYRISLKFGISLDALERANGIVNSNYVTVGQTLIIPLAGVIPTATTGVATVVPLPTTTVTPSGGDATVDAGIISTNTPTAAPTATTAPTAIPTIVPIFTAIPATATAPVANPTSYTVQPGDNLYRVSVKFNTSMQALMQLNNISNPNLLYAGQVLALPGSTTGGSTSGGGISTVVPLPTGTIPSTAGNVGFSFGVVADMTGQDAATVTSKITDLGMVWVKLPVSWRTMEATKGTIDSTALDAQIDAVTESGLKVLLTVTSAPDWSRPTATESGPPTNFSDYANFVGALATRYKGRVLAYEIWNEPNIRREWSGRPLSAASYVEMLRLAYGAIKTADPAALVISAGLSPTGYNDGVNAINDRLFLRQAYTAGLAMYSDAIGVHPGGWANPPDSLCCTASPGVSGWFNDRSFYFLDTLKDYRAIMTDSSDSGTFLWTTEFGWGSSDGVVTDPSTVDQNFGFVKFTSQTQQAQYLPRAYELARTLGYIGPMFVYNLNACQIVGNQPSSTEFKGCYYSLLNTNGDPRPAYDALKAARK
ncbi:MAG: LysM peptidoglycan-binding domain-containing protein [Chloroflexota bacterium]